MFIMILNTYYNFVVSVSKRNDLRYDRTLFAQQMHKQSNN